MASECHTVKAVLNVIVPLVELARLAAALVAGHLHRSC